MRLLRAILWSVAMALTTPLWVVLAAFEIVAFPVRWGSRLCVRIVEPVCSRFVVAVRATYAPGRSEEVHGEAGARFLAKARRARRS